MKYSIGISSSNNPEQSIAEVTEKFENPSFIIYFAQVDMFEDVTKLLKAKYPDCVCMGCSVIVAFSKEGAAKEGMKAIAFESGMTVSANVLEEVSKYPIKYVDRVKKCVEEIGTSENTFCLEFTTAFFCAEESVMSTLNSVLLEKDIPIFGGTAGDPGTAVGTKVALNGVVYDEACVFAILHNDSGAVKIYRENIYQPMNNNVLTATKVDIKKRTVYEYNHQPAVKMYAQEMGVEENEITEYFDSYPMGRIVGDDMYITANCEVADNGGITYHSRIYENSKVQVLQPGDYRTITKQTMDKIHEEIPEPSLAIVCHCLGRTLLFDGENYLQEYAQKLGGVLGDYIGFSGYGEQSEAHQFNQTMVVAVIE